MLSTKRQLGAALKISDSSLKTSHPWAEASVVVCTGARPLDKDCFSSQNLTCVCSVWSQCFPSIYLLAMPKLRFYTEWTLLFLQADFSLGPGIPYKSREDKQMCLKIAIKCLLYWLSLIGGSRHQRGNNQHNCSTTVQLKGRDCTRWTGEEF